MRMRKGCLMVAATALQISCLVVLALCRIVARRCRRWLLSRCPWDRWQTQPPC